MDTLPFINHIFVDFENVHEVDLSLIGQKSIHVTVLMGAKQTKLDAALVEKLLLHADSVQLVRLLESGRNAIDFALAYYVGRAATLDPSGFFHIISGDTGYDPLVAHLRRNHVRAHRHDSFAALKEILANGKSPESPAMPSAPPSRPLDPSSLPTSTPPAKKKKSTLSERIARVLEYLQSHPDTRPTTETRLAHHMPSMLGNGATESDAQQVIKSLRAAKKISISEKRRVTYHL
ncbi:MAG: PIN domain-containing protein [Nibricoccus sp.]